MLSHSMPGIVEPERRVEEVPDPDRQEQSPTTIEATFGARAAGGGCHGGGGDGDVGGGEDVGGGGAGSVIANIVDAFDRGQPG